MASCAIDVYVKLPNGKAISSQHVPTDTVRQIAANVAKGEGLTEARIRLKYQGKILDKSKTIGYLGVRAETILKAEVLFPKDITVIVNLPGGDCQSVRLQNLDTLHALKQRIKDIGGLSESSQIIKTSSGQTLNNDTGILCDLGITDEMLLTVSKKAPVRDLDNTISEEVDEETKMELLNTFDAGGRNVEVVFCFDTTGSMYSCLSTVRNKLRETCCRLFRDIPEIRIGMMANGDYCDFDKYVVCSVDLTRNVDTVVEFARTVENTSGGGNGGEAYEWALRKAQQLDWSEDSAKALVMIGDDIPHAPSYTDQNLFWRDELDVLAGMGVKVYGVQAMNQMSSVPFYEELAERSNGYYLQLKDFNLITDMFLAVCYREADSNQLDAFLEEVENEGRMTENTKLFLDKLDESKSPEEKTAESQERYVASEWWDPSLTRENTTPKYTYHQDIDAWRPCNFQGNRTTSTPPVPVVNHSVTLKKSSKWRRILRTLFRRD